MADTDTRAAAPDVRSYKAMLMQPSDRDELSKPDQQTIKAKIRPSKDAGTPAMATGLTEAPAGPEDSAPAEGASTTSTHAAPMDIKTSGGQGADTTGMAPACTASTDAITPAGATDKVTDADQVSSPRGNLWSPTGNTQTPIDARFSFKRWGSGMSGSVKDDYKLPEGCVVVPQPHHVDDYPSDTEEDVAIPAQGVEADVTDTTQAAVVSEVVSSPRGNLWCPGCTTQTPVDARHSFKKCLSGRQGSVKEDYVLPAGFMVVPQPHHVDDYPSDQEEDTPAAEADTPATQPGATDATTSSQGDAVVSEGTSSPHGNVWSPKGNTQSPIDARFHFQHSMSGRQGSAKMDYKLPEGCQIVPQPNHVDDYPSDQEEAVPQQQQQQQHEGAGLSIKTREGSSDKNGAEQVSSPHGNVWSPKGNTQSPIDARFHFQHSMSGRQGSAKMDYKLPEGSTLVPQPQHVDDHDDEQQQQQQEGVDAADKAGAGAASDDCGSRLGGFSAAEPDQDTAAAATDTPAADSSSSSSKGTDLVSHQLTDEASSSSIGSDAPNSGSNGQDSSSNSNQNPLAAAAAAVAKPVAAVARPVAAAMGQIKNAVMGGQKSERDDSAGAEKSEGEIIAESDAVEIENGDKVLPFAVL